MFWICNMITFLNVSRMVTLSEFHFIVELLRARSFGVFDPAFQSISVENSLILDPMLV